MVWATGTSILLDPALEEVFSSHLTLTLEVDSPQMAGRVIRVQFLLLALNYGTLAGSAWTEVGENSCNPLCQL